MKNDSNTTLLAEALKPLANFPLFYPCSGNDLTAPIKTFFPYIKEFWFVDVGYFPDGNYENVAPVLNVTYGYELMTVVSRLASIEESEWKNDSRYQKCPPLVRTESYRHTATGEIFTVHRHRRTGPSALRTEVGALGIFYYRGDSTEGGRKTHWLTIQKWNHPPSQLKTLSKGCLIFEVLDKLVNGGLLVTDGSMCEGENNSYKELRRFRSNHNIGKQAVEQVEAFTDPMNRKFRCIGYAGESKGPTLIWQVSKP